MFCIKKHRFIYITISLALLLAASGCAAARPAPPAERLGGTERSCGNGESGGFYRDVAAIDYSGLQFTLWDVDAAAAHVDAQERRAYTILIYMNGSDLESEGGAATSDLAEMLRSGLDTGRVNIVIFTGGANRWRNSVIPENECALWRIERDGIVKLCGVGLRNMGDAGTLAGFIDFGLRCYPADKYGLIMWDHGGGSIAGYGHDEKFDSRLTLLEMNYAFERSALKDTKLEFVGFDACLMATVEMAVVTSDYARYLVASEDLEPGDGWDYSCLSALGADPAMDGAAFGRVIADAYMNFYGDETDQDLTLSVTDLSGAGHVMGRMGQLMSRCSGALRDREESFAAFARRRDSTKSFGNGSRRDDDCDMVDIGDMAGQLYDLFPGEAAALADALAGAVVYNRHNSDVDLGGLTTFYIFGGKTNADATLAAYSSLNMSREYTNYLRTFAGAMTGSAQRPVRRIAGGDDILEAYLTLWQPIKGGDGGYQMVGLRSAPPGAGKNEPSGASADCGGLWPRIQGRHVCLHETDRSPRGIEYSIPARHNGSDCDIVVLVSLASPRVADYYLEGRILGARKEEGYIIQKGLDKIRDGDRISFYYAAMDKSGTADKEFEGDEFIVKGELKLDWAELDKGKEYYCSLLTVDIMQNEFYGGVIPVHL